MLESALLLQTVCLSVRLSVLDTREPRLYFQSYVGLQAGGQPDRQTEWPLPLTHMVRHALKRKLNITVDLDVSITKINLGHYPKSLPFFLVTFVMDINSSER